MIAAVFVDTNVLVCARDQRYPEKQLLASAWLDHLWATRAGRISIQVLNEYYSNITRKIRPCLAAEHAWDDVETYFQWNPQASNQQLLERARELQQRFKLNWWDAQIVAAAELQSCSILLTEDLQEGARYGNVLVRSPLLLSVNEAHGSYSTGSAAVVPRHRKPGRPRRVSAFESA